MHNFWSFFVRRNPQMEETSKQNNLKSSGYVISKYTVYFSLLIKGVITFSCLPGSSRRILPLLQYFNFHGLRQSSRRYVYFCRYVCIHRLPAARRKKNAKKNVSQVLETKFVIFIISRSRSENAGLWGAQSGFFNKGKLVILRNATTL